MIFLLQGDLGDCITMLPSVMEYRRLHAGTSLVLADPRVKALLPQYDWLLNERSLPMYSIQNVVAVNVWSAVEIFGKDLHPTRMFFRYLGLDDPGEAVRPEIAVADASQIPQAFDDLDFLIAPCANDGARAMRLDFSMELVTRLEAEFPGARIGWIGGASDFGLASQPEAESSRQMILGQPLPLVAAIMSRTRKAVITVDSMANRLAHAAGIENHVLLCSDVVPEAWATHPGARVLYGSPSSWTTEKVLELLPA